MGQLIDLLLFNPLPIREQAAAATNDGGDAGNGSSPILGIEYAGNGQSHDESLLETRVHDSAGRVVMDSSVTARAISGTVCP